MWTVSVEISMELTTQPFNSTVFILSHFADRTRAQMLSLLSSDYLSQAASFLGSKEQILKTGVYLALFGDKWLSVTGYAIPKY